MADTTFYQVRPDLKAIDLGETPTVYSMAVVPRTSSGSDLTFENTSVVAEPLNTSALKAIDLGDGTYGVSMVLV